jgi:transcriptional regulator with XRE-family HTH domain
MVTLGTAMDRRGATITDVARAAQRDRVTVWRILTGRTTNPDTETRERIARALRMNMYDIRWGSTDGR